MWPEHKAKAFFQNFFFFLQQVVQSSRKVALSCGAKNTFFNYYFSSGLTKLNTLIVRDEQIESSSRNTLQCFVKRHYVYVVQMQRVLDTISDKDLESWPS